MYKKPNLINRRQFLRWVSILGISGYLTACRMKTFPLSPTEGEQQLLTGEATQLQEYKPPETSATVEQDASPDMTKTQNPNIRENTRTPVASATRSENSYLSVVRGSDIEAIVTAAVAAVGGIERFVQNGSDVIIKPNICTNYYSFEYAATTNPTVVATLVRLCKGAGASRVRVMDQPFAGDPESAYTRSGIADAVAAADGEMEIMNWNKYVNVEIPDGLDLKEWEFYKPILDADVLIDVPIAKHHGLTGLTLAGKNLLGTISNRSGIHRNYGQRIADLVSRVRPALTIVDAVRILMRNGPTGGNLDDVQILNTIIASHDIIAADSYAATLFGLSGADIAYIAAGANMGLGTMDLNAIKVEEINL